VCVFLFFVFVIFLFKFENSWSFGLENGYLPVRTVMALEVRNVWLF